MHSLTCLTQNPGVQITAAAREFITQREFRGNTARRLRDTIKFEREIGRENIAYEIDLHLFGEPEHGIRT
jgi:hypothetical protein